MIEVMCPWCQKKVIVHKAMPTGELSESLKDRGLTFGDGVRFGLGLMFSVWLISAAMLVLLVACFGNPLAGLL